MFVRASDVPYNLPVMFLRKGNAVYVGHGLGGKAEEKPQTTTTASISFGTGPITGTPFSFGISSAKPVQSDKAGK